MKLGQRRNSNFSLFLSTFARFFECFRIFFRKIKRKFQKYYFFRVNVAQHTVLIFKLRSSEKIISFRVYEQENKNWSLIFKELV